MSTLIPMTPKKKEKMEIFFSICLKISDLNENIHFTSPDNLNEEKLYSNIYQKGSDSYNLLIYYANTENEKNSSNFEIKFKIKDIEYKLSFETKSNIVFVFLPNLELLKFFRNQSINQTIIGFKEKFIGFCEALKYKNKISYDKNLVHEAINTFERDQTIEYFLLLFSHCYNQKDVYKLFCLFPPEIKDINENYNFREKQNIFEEIYLQKKEIFDKLEKEKNKSNKKKEKEKFEIIYYFAIIYFFLTIKDKEKSSEIIKVLYDKEKGILFEILKKYSSIFQKFHIVDKDLLNELLSDPNEKDFKCIKNILKYENDLLSILQIINSNKEIFKKFVEKDSKKNVINIFESTKQNKNDDIQKICIELEELINYQKKTGYLFLELDQNFWKYYLDNFNDIQLESINKLINLRKCLNNYQLLTQSKKVHSDKRKIGDYFLKDDYGSTIHNRIQNIIKIEKFDDLEKLNMIFKNDPFYLEDSKKKLISVDILREFDFKNIQKEEFFIQFKELKLDRVFDYKLKEFFNYIFSLIRTIYDFELLYKLFDIEKLSEKGLNEYINCLKNKFKEINLKIDKNQESDFNKILQLIVILVDIIIKKQPKNAINFFQLLEEKCQDDIYEIYISLLNLNQDINDEKIINHIFSKFKNSDNYIEYSINLLSKIKDDKKKKKYFENLKGYIFNYNDFFINKKDSEIKFYISLKEKNLLEKKSEFYIKINEVLENISKKMTNFDIEKPNIELLLKLTENQILERLNLVNNNPKELYNKIQSKNIEINKEIQKLKNIKDLLSIYYSNYLKNNKEIDNIIYSLEKNYLNEIDKKNSLIKTIYEKHQKDIETIIKVKDSLLFDMIYENNKKEIKDEKKLFTKSILDLDNKKNIIKDPEDKDISSKFLKDFLSLFKNNNKLKDELTILSKYFNLQNIDFDSVEDKIIVLLNKNNYLKEVKNISFLLEKLKVKETDFLKKLKEIISNFEALNNESNKEKKQYDIIKLELDYLKNEKIYDYKNNNDKYLNIYRYFYDNELAIAFLLDKDSDSSKHLAEKLDPMETTLTIKDINCFQNCILFFEDLKLNDMATDKEVFYDIKKKIEEDNSILESLESYSNNYRSIKEFDQNFDEKNSITNKIEENINSGIYYFYQEKDQYKINEQLIERGYDYLYDLKCKINVKRDENEDEKLKEKNKKLEYFENIVDKIATIKYYVNALRNKGSQIELLIEVHFCYDSDKDYGNGKFTLDGEEKTFKEIKKYLIKVKNYYMKLLTTFYLNDEYIRFAYGKQFNFIVNYLKANNEDNSFANYFLNDVPKRKLERGFPVQTDDSMKNYKIYLKNTLQNISNYIQNYFKDNYKSLEAFYNKYKVINNKKGINYFNSEECSIEEKAIDLFIEFTGKYPISQNILLINKDTSLEEMESFLYRSILCKYHSLFIIGINDILPSQEDYLMKITNFLINYIKERDNPNSKNKRRIEADIKPCIIFIYNKNQSQNKFIEQIKKIACHKDLTRKIKKEDENNSINKIKFGKRQQTIGSISNYLTTQDKVDKIKSEVKIENVTIYLSNVNGTGKTFAIREDVKKNELIYKYFPFGGYLTKDIVYKRIKDLLEEIHKEEENKDKIGIHLDLYETEQQGIMNDFLFSFLFTKYYKNDENVIYIPKDYKIYVEIPNCFINFMDTYPILNIFQNEQRKEINLENQRELELRQNEELLFNNLINIDVEHFTIIPRAKS